MSRTGLRLNRYVESFDESYDVVVVGLGFAGAVTAIEAHDRGARVLIVEKMPDPGGISICSGGGVRCTNDANSAYEYVKATNAGTARDDVVRTFANGMAGGYRGTLKRWLTPLMPRLNGSSVAGPIRSPGSRASPTCK
jgi:succinate dehydrogenase/fumarate reductase flavoprotein subunit